MSKIGDSDCYLNTFEDSYILLLGMQVWFSCNEFIYYIHIIPPADYRLQTLLETWSRIRWSTMKILHIFHFTLLDLILK